MGPIPGPPVLLLSRRYLTLEGFPPFPLLLVNIAKMWNSTAKALFPPSFNFQKKERRIRRFPHGDFVVLLSSLFPPFPFRNRLSALAFLFFFEGPVVGSGLQVSSSSFVV